MVHFECTVQEGKIPEDIRGALAGAIKSACRDVLSSGHEPEIPVSVEWVEIPKGFGFRGGRLSTTSLVRGKIPDGCDREARSRLLMRIGDEWCRISGASQEELVVSARDRSWAGKLATGVKVQGKERIGPDECLITDA